MSAVARAVTSFSHKSLPSEPPLSPCETVAETVSTVWNSVYSSSVGVVSRVYHILRSAIGAPVRDLFFFPLSIMDFSLMKSLFPNTAKQLQIEEAYGSDFWNPSKPLDPNFPLQQKMRNAFSVREQAVLIETETGKTVQVTCRIIESKGLRQRSPAYNFVYAPGIFNTVRNTAAGIYPYLAAYLKKKEHNRSLPPARFMIISENDIQDKDTASPYRPASMEEAGTIFHHTVHALQAQYGKADQLAAHSMGCIFAASALKHFEARDLPKNLSLDRGPTSIWEISKKRLFSLGWCTIYPLAKLVGWSLDLEQQLADLCARIQNLRILISGVEQDHHFSGTANLCLGETTRKLQLAGRVNVLYFDPPRQVVHEAAHHNLRSDYLRSLYLKHPSKGKALIGGTSLAEEIVSRSIASKAG